MEGNRERGCPAREVSGMKGEIEREGQTGKGGSTMQRERDMPAREVSRCMGDGEGRAGKRGANDRG